MAGKRSEIWNYFKNCDGKRAYGKHCLVSISYNGGSIRHPFINTKAKQINSGTSEQPPQSDQPAQHEQPGQNEQPTHSEQLSINNFYKKRPTKGSEEKINMQLVKMIAKGHHALRMVDEPELVKFVEMVSKCSTYTMPCRKTLSQKLIPRVCNDIEAEVREKLQQTFAVCLTTDGWTSSTNVSYIAATAHFIDDNTKLCSALLCCEEFDASHTGANLCNFLKEVMERWNVSHKVAATVSDSAANILSAVKLGQWRSISCFAHLLNLVVQKGLGEIADIAGKVKNIAEYFNRSTQGTKRLKDFQVQMQMPVLKLKQSVPTRWNSTYEMLSRIVEVKDAVMSTIAILRSDLIISNIEWEIIEGALPILKPFYEVTIEISSEKNVKRHQKLSFSII
ncbi:PREDICTED: zinc finger BED domain-containing protein 4-like, partial [Rhagoletis zephyria]|uniref:zinc finger BED domain-containing protein 4-like n=1 Tax=Rhagoletis zephyria TaxID=28612 RepID=UPI0008114997